MTVIVYANKTLVVDRAVVSGSTSTLRSKATTVGDTVAVAYGGLGACATLLAWYKMGADSEAYPYKVADNAQLIVLQPTGDIHLYERGGHPTTYGSPDKCCFGEGADLAYGALAMGAGALEAAKIACQYNTLCSLPLDVYRTYQKGISHETVSG